MLNALLSEKQSEVPVQLLYIKNLRVVQIGTANHVFLDHKCSEHVTDALCVVTRSLVHLTATGSQSVLLPIPSILPFTLNFVTLYAIPHTTCR